MKIENMSLAWCESMRGRSDREKAKVWAKEKGVKKRKMEYEEFVDAGCFHNH